MAQAMASMAVNGSLHLGGSRRASASRLSAGRSAILSIRAQQASAEGEVAAAQTSGRRAMLGLAATALAGGSLVQAVLADATAIKVGPPPPLSGGLPGTLNSDEARDLDLKLQERFYLQSLTLGQIATRVRDSAKEIVNVKALIDKKAWPYVQNDLRLRATYLRFDLSKAISAKPKDEKPSLKKLTDALFSKIDGLDHAAKIKSSKEAEKYYAETVAALDSVLAKLG